jgi:hypothetical protein
MVDGITLHSAHNPESLPDNVMQVAEMVRFLSNKYVPTPSLDKFETDLLLSLKEFCHQALKRAAAVTLHKRAPSNNPQNNPMTSQLTNVFDIDSWHEAQLADPNDNEEFCYGLGSNLYDKISAFPEVDSGHKHVEQVLTHLESDEIRMLSSL